MKVVIRLATETPSMHWQRIDPQYCYLFIVLEGYVDVENKKPMFLNPVNLLFIILK